MRDGFLYWFVTMLVRRLPMLLLALAGILFAIIRWPRHPRASLMTVLALLAYLLDAILFNVFLYWLPEMTRSLELSVTARRWMDSVIFFLEDFVTAGILLLLVGAAFTGRKNTLNSTPEST